MIGAPISAASPPTRLAPTTLMGVLTSRSSPPIASNSFGIFDGNFASAWKVWVMLKPV